MTDIFALLKGKPEDSDYNKKGVIVQGITEHMAQYIQNK